MLVSHRKKFIFTKTLKTAGTSVESYYEPYCMPEGCWEEVHLRDEYESEAGIIGYRGTDPGDCRYCNHMSASKIRDLVGSKVWNDYFKFTVVRNPFSKLVSGWYHFHRPNVTMKKTIRALSKKPTSIPLVLMGKRDIHDFRTWLRKGRSIMDRDKYLIDGEVCMDFFIRQESLQDDIKSVNAMLGIEQDERVLPKFYSGIRSADFSIRDFYDKETEAIVRQLYDWEFERFGYDMPDG